MKKMKQNLALQRKRRTKQLKRTAQTNLMRIKESNMKLSLMRKMKLARKMAGSMPNFSVETTNDSTGEVVSPESVVRSDEIVDIGGQDVVGSGNDSVVLDSDGDSPDDLVVKESESS